MNARTSGLLQWLAFGTGAGIQVSGDDLEVAVARVRPTGIHVLGRTTIPRFRERPAAVWGAEYSAFLKKLGAGYLSATVLLPRPETVVRLVPMRGVAPKDIEAALAFQLDTLNPYGDEEVLTGWMPLGDGNVLAGVVRRETIDRYLELFAAAGISAASFTFAAAAVHAAIRLGAPPPAAFLALGRAASGATLVYGESPARPAFWAEFELPPERAAALAAPELRLEPDIAPLTLESLLPAPQANPVENDLSRNPLPYAVALAGACPHFWSAANLLPPERRTASSRAILIPTAICAAALLLVLGATLAWPSFDHRRYLQSLGGEISSLEPLARRAAMLDRQIDRDRARARLLDEFRSHTRADMDVLNELSRLLPPPVWTTQLELSRDSVAVSGEADQAAPLIKVLDASPFFRNSEFNGISKVQNAETFRLRTQRRPGK